MQRLQTNCLCCFQESEPQDELCGPTEAPERKHIRVFTFTLNVKSLSWEGSTAAKGPITCALISRACLSARHVCILCVCAWQQSVIKEKLCGETEEDMNWLCFSSTAQTPMIFNWFLIDESKSISLMFCWGRALQSSAPAENRPLSVKHTKLLWLGAADVSVSPLGVSTCGLCSQDPEGPRGPRRLASFVLVLGATCSGRVTTTASSKTTVKLRRERRV